MRRPRLTFANVVSVLALFLALGGSSYAALTVTGKNVRNGSLTGKDVKKNSLTGRQIKESKLAKVPTAGIAGRAEVADRARTAGTADTATTATNAGNANTVGGKSTDELGIRAYAYVEADGTIAPGRAKNVLSSFVPAPPYAHVRCFQVSFTPKIGIATSASTSFARIVAVISERATIDAVCGATNAEAVAYAQDDAGNPTNTAFSILFE